MNYNEYILTFGTIIVYYYLVTRSVNYFILKDCNYTDSNACKMLQKFEYSEEECDEGYKEYDKCRSDNDLKRLYAILPIALLSMIGGLFIPNKPISIAISMSGLLLLFNIVADNWSKMDEKTKLILMGVTFIILILTIINIEKAMKFFTKT